MVELTSLLCSTSFHIDSKQRKLQSLDNSVAYASMRSSDSSSSASRDKSFFQSNSGTFRGGGRQPHSRGRTTYSSSQLIFQICGKGNHTALDC